MEVDTIKFQHELVYAHKGSSANVQVALLIMWGSATALRGIEEMIANVPLRLSKRNLGIKYTTTSSMARSPSL